MLENEEKLIDTFDEKMQMIEYEIMMIKKLLHDQIKKMIFSNIAYILVSKFTLISINKFKKKRFIWNMHKNTLQIKIIDQDICEISEKYELSMIEFNSIFFSNFYFSFVNVVQINNQQKIIEWI